MNGEFELLKVPLNHLVLGSTAQSNQKLGICGLCAIEGQRNELIAFDICRCERLLLASEKIHEKDDRYLGCLLAPSQIPFVLTLSYGGDAFGAGESIDEALSLFVFVGGAESVEDDGVGCWEDESVFFGIRVV
jgi:hypothetical protein